MHKKSKKQLPLMNPAIDHPRARELESISYIFNQEATIVDMVHQDLCRGVFSRATGACGMSAKQVLRAAVEKGVKSALDLSAVNGFREHPT